MQLLTLSINFSSVRFLTRYLLCHAVTLTAEYFLGDRDNLGREKDLCGDLLITSAEGRSQAAAQLSNPQYLNTLYAVESKDEGESNKCQVSKEKMTPLSLCSGGWRFFIQCHTAVLDPS